MRPFSSIPQALADVRRGRMLIVVDESGREDEADFFLPAEIVKPADVNLMIKQGGGILCVAMTQKQRRRLGLPLMVQPRNNTEKTGVNFTVSVNAAKKISSGVSAFDRAKTIRVLADLKSQPADLVCPGHVFGLVAHAGGLKNRPGHTEAAVALSELGGYSPAGALCEIIGKNGRMAKLPELRRLAAKLKIRMITIRDLAGFVNI